MWREVQSGGAMIDDIWVREGCIVGVGVYAVHHNPDLYQRPFDFVPERWLKEGADGAASAVAKGAYIPFSYGPRSCVGSKLAMAQILLTLSNIMWRYDIKDSTKDGTEDTRSEEYVLVDHFTGVKTGPILHYRQRSA